MTLLLDDTQAQEDAAIQIIDENEAADGLIEEYTENIEDEIQ